LARKHSAHVSGGAFNIGGGVGNTLSVLELVDVIEELTGERPQVIFVPERTDDARYYVADTRRFRGRPDGRHRSTFAKVCASSTFGCRSPTSAIAARECTCPRPLEARLTPPAHGRLRL